LPAKPRQAGVVKIIPAFRADHLPFGGAKELVVRVNHEITELLAQHLGLLPP